VVNHLKVRPVFSALIISFGAIFFGSGFYFFDTTLIILLFLVCSGCFLIVLGTAIFCEEDKVVTSYLAKSSKKKLRTFLNKKIFERKKSKEKAG
jgi:hypothetical protein